MRLRRIRIVQITHGMGVGGMERVIADLCRHLDRRVYEVAVYCTHTLGPLAKELREQGVPVAHRPVRRRSDHWLRPLRVYGFLRQCKPDIVHTQHMAAFLDSALPARLAGVPVLVHTDHSKHYPERRRYMLAERVLSGLTDSFCAVSEHTKLDLVRYEKLPASRVEVVYNGYDPDDSVDPDDRRAARAKLGIPEDAPLLGNVARVEWQKGQELLISAMPHVLARVPGAHAVIVGGGTFEERLRRQVKDLGLTGMVHLTGLRLDAVRLLPAFDLFVMTSQFEGMPIALLEAMHQSLPVLATAVGGVPEVVEDGVTGHLVHDRDPIAFAHAAVDLLLDRERLLRYGRAGRERYSSRFRVDAMVRTYDRIYRGCLEAREPGWVAEP